MSRETEMAAFDRLPYPLRRAIDESLWGMSAELIEGVIQRGRFTAEEATARILGWTTWRDAARWHEMAQRVCYGRVSRQFI